MVSLTALRAVVPAGGTEDYGGTGSAWDCFVGVSGLSELVFVCTWNVAIDSSLVSFPTKHSFYQQVLILENFSN